MRLLCYLCLPALAQTRVEGDVSLTRAVLLPVPRAELGSWGGDPDKLRRQFLLPGGASPLSLVGGSSLGSRNAHLLISRNIELVQSIACAFSKAKAG